MKSISYAKLQEKSYGTYQPKKIRPTKNCDSYRFLSFSFLSGMTLARSRSVVCRALSKHSPVLGAVSQDHGRLSVVHISNHSNRKTCTHVLDSLVRATKEWEAVGTSTSTDACACAGDPQLCSYRRRFHTEENLEKIAQKFRLLGSCLELQSFVRKPHTCQTPGSVPRDTPEKLSFMKDSLVRASQQQRWKNQDTDSCLSLSGSLGLVVRSGHAKVRGVVFHTTRWTQCRTRKCVNEQRWQAAHCRTPKAVRCLTGADCGCGQLHCAATENRTDCDHGRHRPAMGTPTRTTSSANS